MSFEMKIVISTSGGKAKKLLKEYPHSQIYAKHGYSGIMIPCEDEAEYDKIDNDEIYAEKKLNKTTLIL